MTTTFNGFTALSDYPPASGQFTSPGDGFKQVYTRNRGFAVVLEAMARRWQRDVEPIAPSHIDNWFKPRERKSVTTSGKYDLIGIHSYRPPGTTVGKGDRSNHRSATCIDINGHLHEYEATSGVEYDDNFTQSQRNTVRAIAASIKDSAGRQIGRSGLDFARGLRDGVHLEIDHGATQTHVNQAAKKLENFVGRSSTANVFWKNAKGLDVKEVQTSLKRYGFGITYLDGKAGDEFDAALKEFQSAVGIEPDGRFGPNARQALRNYEIPTPPPKPIPEPTEEVIPNMDDYTIAGPDRYSTSAMVAIESGHTTFYLVSNELDGMFAATLGDGAILLVKDGKDDLPAPIVEAILTVKPVEVYRVGGSSRVTDKALFVARTHAGLKS